MLTLRSPYFDSNTTLQMYEILLLSMDPRLRATLSPYICNIDSAYAEVDEDVWISGGGNDDGRHTRG
jgi:hypothetical protein